MLMPLEERDWKTDMNVVRDLANVWHKMLPQMGWLVAIVLVLIWQI